MKKFLRFEFMIILLSICYVLGVVRVEAQPSGTSIFDNIICNHINGASCPGSGGGGIVNGVTASVPLASSGGSTPNISVANKIGNSNIIQYGSGSDTSGNCARFDASGNIVDAGAPCGTGTGGVTSVTSSDSRLTASPTTGAVVIDLTSVRGTGSSLQATTGSATTNDCIKFDANGNVIDAGAPCGTGSGTVTGVTGTSPIASSGGTAPAISCPTCLTTGSSYVSSVQGTSPIVASPTTGATVITCPTCLTTASGQVVTRLNYQSGNPLSQVINTTAETTMYSFTVPGNTMSTSSAIDFVLDTELFNNSVVSNLTWKLYLGSTVIMTFGPTGFTNTSPLFDFLQFRCRITNRGSLSSQSCFCSAFQSATVASGQFGLTQGVNAFTFTGGNNAISVDMSTNQSISATAQFTTASSNLYWSTFDGALQLTLQ